MIDFRRTDSFPRFFPYIEVPSPLNGNDTFFIFPASPSQRFKNISFPVPFFNQALHLPIFVCEGAPVKAEEGSISSPFCFCFPGPSLHWRFQILFVFNSEPLHVIGSTTSSPKFFGHLSFSRHADFQFICPTSRLAGPSLHGSFPAFSFSSSVQWIVLVFPISTRVVASDRQIWRNFLSSFFFPRSSLLVSFFLTSLTRGKYPTPKTPPRDVRFAALQQSVFQRTCLSPF